MSYIVIGTHGGPEYAAICTDENGIDLLFDIRKESDAEAAESQGGLIVEL